MKKLSRKTALQKTKKTLPVTAGARPIHTKILHHLKEMQNETVTSCTSNKFKEQWLCIGRLIDDYQQEIAGAAALTKSCRIGCAECCNHWVEDVNSFEAGIIADYLKQNQPHRLPFIVERCQEDIGILERLNSLVERKLSASLKRDRKTIDPVDLLLAIFYQMRRPCPLLDQETCSIYPVRPLTCRMYVSFSDCRQCSPDFINDGEIPTYIFNLEEKANMMIDRLHFRFQRFKNDSGLRSLLVKYLSVME